MIVNRQVEMVRRKYPFLLDNDTISLYAVGLYLNIYNLFNKSSNNELKILGLEDFKEDLSWILGDVKKERKEKLKKLNSIYANKP